MKKQAIILLALLSGTMAQAAVSSVSTFEENRLAPESHWGGAGSSETGFNSGPAYFPADSYKYYWGGYVYSNETDMTTAGYGNQFSAYLAGGENNKSGNQYAVSYPDGSDIELGSSSVVSGVWVTNTTYTYLSMSQGDSFARKFGGVSGNDADWFKLTATGVTAEGGTSSIDFLLADFTSADNSQDYIIDTWTWFDLSSLGSVAAIEFSLSSSDMSYGYMNTPGYFAFDNFNGSELVAPLVPEPTCLALLAGGVALLGRRKKIVNN